MDETATAEEAFAHERAIKRTEGMLLTVQKCGEFSLVTTTLGEYIVHRPPERLIYGDTITRLDREGVRCVRLEPPMELKPNEGGGG